MLDRYKVLDRYEYNQAFEGFALTVEDLEGLENYNAFLDALEQDPDILWIEPDISVSSPTPDGTVEGNGQKIPWSVAAVGGKTSWSRSGDGTGDVDVDIYILDTGVMNEELNIVESIDFRDDANDTRDNEGHGTHVAGIAAAIDDHNGLVGVAPGARVFNYKVLNDDGSTDISVVVAAIEHIMAKKNDNPSRPMVVNLSLGADVGKSDYTTLDYAIDAASNLGIVVVVAAGNQGVEASKVTPAHAEGAITVGSHDVNGVFSPFSNYGPAIDILAPGEAVLSLRPQNGNGPGAAISMSGTSMAAPHVTGAAALYLAQHPLATPYEVRNALLANAQRFAVGLPPNTTNHTLWVGETGMNCYLEGNIVSEFTNWADLVIINEASYSINLFWIDYSGNRDYLATIGPGKQI